MKIKPLFKCRHEIIFNRIFEILKLYLNNSINLDCLKVKTTLGKTLLFYANTRIELIEYLVNKGANINAVDNKGNTILHEIIFNPNIPKTEVYALLEKLFILGIDINLKNNNGISIASFLNLVPKQEHTNTQLVSKVISTEEKPNILSHECIICYTDPANYAIIPCGHLIFCEKCNKDHANKLKECPMCKNKIIQICKIFF